MNFWLLKQLREYCRVNDGATALHENPAVLIWKISTSVFIDIFFPFPCFDLYELYWLWAFSKGMVYLKLGTDFDCLGLKDSKISW